MSIIERSVRQPVAVTVGVLLVLIFGLSGILGWFEFLKLPVQLTPNVDQPVVTVTTTWFGANPKEVEQEILREQEEVLKSVSGLREMVSTAYEGRGEIKLTYSVGVDKEAALNEVRDKLRTVPSYPPDVDEPVVESVDPAANTPIAWMLVRAVPGEDPTMRPAVARIPGYTGDIKQLQDFLDDEVKPLLERVPGVAKVEVLGGRERQMQVRVDLNRLAARGITVSQFTDALRRENLNVTAGAVSLGKREISVRAMGQYEDDPEAILETVIAYTPAGVPVKVGDVAEVDIGYQRQVAFVRSMGEPVVAINVRRETGSNVLSVMRELRQAIEQVNREVLGQRQLALELFQVYDESLYVSRSLDNARGDVIVGAILATLVLLFTLRSVGATLSIALSIPVAIFGTFLGMALAGRNLNVISMAGMAFSIGMGIDNAIVVLENIFRHREMGKDRLRAAIDGAREVWGAILAATLTNVAVFVPIIFIQEEAGQLFRDVAVAVTISMFLYLAVSPTVIPMLAGRFLRKMPGGFVVEGDPRKTQTLMGRLTAPVGRIGEALSSVFYRIILWLTAGVVRRVVLLVVVVGIPGYLSWILVPQQTYLPQGNQNFVFAMIQPPPGYSLDEFEQMARLIESRIGKWWKPGLQGTEEHRKLQEEWVQANRQKAEMFRQQLDQMRQAVEAGFMPREQFEMASGYMMMQIQQLENSKPPPAIDNFFFVAWSGMAFMGASSQDPDVVTPLVDVMNQAMEGIPGTGGFAFHVPIFNLGTSVGNGLEVVVSGTDYDQVRQTAAIIRGTMMQQFQTFVMGQPMNFDLDRNELRIVPNRLAAASAGIPTPAIREAATVGVDGVIIGDYRIQGQTIDLVVVANGTRASGTDADADLNDLRAMPLATPDGRIVPLGTVAHFVETTAPQQILRYNRLPAVTLSVELPPNMTIDAGRQILDQNVLAPLRAQGVIPPGVIVSVAGSAAKLDQFKQAFIPGVVLAAVVTYLLMAALYESWLYPLVIMLTVPMAMLGGVWGLAILHAYVETQLLDVLTMLGFVILIGVVVNNPILIVHQALNFMHNMGMDTRHAIAKSTQTRVRPIFMSVITSVAGMTPLVVLGGAGSELYRGLGAVVIGGLMVSTVFTLFLTPTLLSLMIDAQNGLRRLFRRTPAPSRPAEEKEPEVAEPVSGGR